MNDTGAPAAAGWRAWLGRRLPRAGSVGKLPLSMAVLFAGSLILRESWLGGLLRAAFLITLLWSAIYYTPRLLRRFTGALLWRVRRRLMITYLFVGFTPILLLVLLGMIAGFGASAEAMARLVTAQLELMTRQAAQSAGALAGELARSPEALGNGRLRTWLQERDTALQAVLPGARLALWCCDGSAAAGAGSRRAEITAAPRGAEFEPLGGGPQEPGEPLPGWLRTATEWSGAVLRPGPAGAAAGTVHLRAVSRGRAGGAPFALLVDVPLSRALLDLLRQATAIDLRRVPVDFEVNAGGEPSPPDSDEIRAGESDAGEEEAAATGDVAATGDMEAAVEASIPGDGSVITASGKLPYLVVLSLVSWSSGKPDQQSVLLFDWSWAGAVRQFFGGSFVGRVWQYILAGVALLFLALELAAILAAVWMTRAVTGTVHELHRATQRVRLGDFSYRARAGSRDQLGDLAEAFNDMSASIESLLVERVQRERLEREVEIAAEVQAGLFPMQVPALPGVEISAECRAARGVSGDYYDYVEVGPRRVLVALGDVSGKGISAALLMSNLQASLRAQAGILAAANGAAPAGESAAVPEGVLARLVSVVNEQLCRSTAVNRFATLFLALYDGGDRSLRYVSAGQGTAILVSPGGSFERLSHGGTVIGAFEKARYEEAATTLEAGALLVLFSDGLSEAENGAGEQFGEERLAACAVSYRTRPVYEVRGAIFDAVQGWSGSRERGDDQTLVVVRARAA